jgi:hypothetical protein
MSMCVLQDPIAHADHYDSTRKWKDKLKEWKFDKNLNISDMNIVVAKQQKRAREGKDTVFMHGSIEMTSERIETFKRRKITKVTDAVSPSAGK